MFAPFEIYKLGNDKYQKLKLNNPRIIRINDGITKLFGVRLIGFKGKVELYSESQPIQIEMYKLLRRYCILYHLQNEINLIKVIGKGSFSRVHLASRLST